MRYMDMPAHELRAAYWAERRNVASWNAMAMPGHARRTRAKIAGGVYRGLDRLDLICRCAAKRGIHLL